MDFFCGWQTILVFVAYALSEIYVVTSESSSRFTVLPQSQTIVEGDAVIFTCQATAEEALKYSWTHNGQLIQNNSRRIYQIDANLHIDAVRQESDYGDYVCIATTTTTGARLASPPARLSIIWIQTANVQLLSNSRNEVVLKCHVDGSSGDGLLEIEWFRNSEKLSTIQNVELKENRLIVHNPTYYDNGLYRCIASNAAGRAMSKKGYILKWSDNNDDNVGKGIGGAFASSCIPRLKKNQKLPETIQNQIFLCRGKRGGAGGGSVGGDDNVKNMPADVNILQGPNGKKVVKENEPIELPCQYKVHDKYLQQQEQQQNGSVQLRWRKDGKVFRQIELGQNTATTAEPNKDLMLREDSRIVLNRQNGSLLFTSVIASDAGQYVCQIYVKGHSPITSEAGELQVIEQLKFVPQPTSKNLELSSVGKVHCKAQGTPTPIVKWIRDIDSAAQLPETIDDINGTLIFKNVSAEHRGNYTCIASNSQGQINATIGINVVVAPKFSVAPEGPIETIEMGTAVIHCQAIGDPKPTIQWDKDLKYLSENNTDRNRFHFLENGTLEIREVHLDDDGRYGCTIGNSAGLKREEVRFIVKSAEGYIAEEPTDGFLITRAVLITMSVAFAYIILVVGLMIWCRYRRQARKARLNEANKDNPESGHEGKSAENEPCLPDANSNKNHHPHGGSGVPKVKKVNGNNNPRGGSGNEAQKSDDTNCSNHSKNSKKSNAFDQLTLPRTGISELIQIGRGEFGDVFVGKIKSSLVVKQLNEKDLIENETSSLMMKQQKGNELANGSATNTTSVAVAIEKRRSKTSMDDIEEIKEEQESGNGDMDIEAKTNTDEYKLTLVKALNKIKDENACQEFKRQIEMFRAISHKGVVRLFGLCREKDPHFMVLEYTDWGDLKQFLLATAGKVNTSTNSTSPPPLKTGQILAVAYQIARGMDAIYRARFIHKDLAARNCIISSDFIVKVSYPGLCKDKYAREYFKHRNSLLPIRWLAPECLQEDEFTTKSDIFAYGVFVWELFNQATKMPFEELSNDEVLHRGQAGKLEWTCAEATPESLKDILTSCWHSNPKERPSFSQLAAALSKSMQNTSDK